MRQLSRCDLDVISRRVLRAYWRLPEAMQSPDCVNPTILLTKLLGLKIDYRRLSHDGQILGMTSFCEIGIELEDCEANRLYYLDGKTVLIDSQFCQENAVEGRRNFTIAHEGSHHILNMLFPGEYSGGLSARKVLNYRASKRPSRLRTEEEWEEWQTDTLSSAILMPKYLLCRHLVDEGFPNGIFRLNKICDMESYDAFTRISEKMRVSKQALSYRMERLGLLKQNYLSNPYDILDIWKDENEDD